MATGGGTGHLNRLATAKSPYLRQHATNPVDWYPFERAALDKAKAENKVRSLLNELTTWQVIFLSIGYSACHWSFPHLESQLTPGAMYSIPFPLLTTGNGTRVLREARSSRRSQRRFRQYQRSFPHHFGTSKCNIG